MPLKARQAALEYLNLFEELLLGKKSISPGRLSRIEGNVEPKDLALFKKITKGILRWKNRLDSIIREFSDRPARKIDATMLNCLRIGLYEMFYLTKIPSYACVNEAVELASSRGSKGKGFVNAILRESIRKKDRIPLVPGFRTTEECINLFFSYPEWLSSYMVDLFGKEKALAAAQSLNEEEPQGVRVNRLRTDGDWIKPVLGDDSKDFSPSEYVDGAFIYSGGSNLTSGKAFQDGLFYIQNPSSQIISTLLHPRTNEAILDACAGPGGKATHICELASDNLSLYAMDISEDKLRLIRENASRLGLKSIKTVRGDASKKLPDDIPQTFDRIVADLPCSALGTIRKEPEIKWLKTIKDIKRLASYQLGILNNLVSYLKPAGSILYSVCTFSREETFEVAKKFLEANPDFEVEPFESVPGTKISDFITNEGFLFIPPTIRELEAFFAAAFRKRS